jgi:hypothetical protein
VQSLVLGSAETAKPKSLVPRKTKLLDGPLTLDTDTGLSVGTWGVDSVPMATSSVGAVCVRRFPIALDLEGVKEAQLSPDNRLLALRAHDDTLQLYALQGGAGARGGWVPGFR